MKTLIGPFTLIAFFALFICSSAYSQACDEKTASPNRTGRTGEIVKDKKDHADLILVPATVTDESYRDRIRDLDPFRQAGGFYSAFGWGFEYTMRGADSHLYGALFAGNITNPERRIPDAQYIVMAGITVGYETLIGLPGLPARGEVLRADVDGTQFYARIGPGFGVAGTGQAANGELEIHPLIHTTTGIGALRRVARRTAVFAEMGGRLAWLPTLSEMRFMGGPHLSVGFLIFPPERIPVYQY